MSIVCINNSILTGNCIFFFFLVLINCRSNKRFLDFQILGKEKALEIVPKDTILLKNI